MTSQTTAAVLEQQEAIQTVAMKQFEAATRIDPTLVELNFRLRNLQLAIGYRVQHFYALNDPELQEIVKEARKVASEIVLYTATLRQPD